MSHHFENNLLVFRVGNLGFKNYGFSNLALYFNFFGGGRSINIQLYSVPNVTLFIILIYEGNGSIVDSA
jgi:hypothetical protein